MSAAKTPIPRSMTNHTTPGRVETALSRRVCPALIPSVTAARATACEPSSMGRSAGSAPTSPRIRFHHSVVFLSPARSARCEAAQESVAIDRIRHTASRSMGARTSGGKLCTDSKMSLIARASSRTCEAVVVKCCTVNSSMRPSMMPKIVLT